MINIGIIAEYNPFHNGHAHQIKMIKEKYPDSNIIVLMSGNFVQRGNVSIVDKFTRTKMALLEGADMVLELPPMFAISSASYFAKAGVSIFDKTNIIDYLCFGTENTTTEKLEEISYFLINEPAPYKKLLKSHLKDGLSYPKSRSLALLEFGYKNTLDTPNNILGVEYIKSLIEISSEIKPFTINRTNDYHDTKITTPISSATSIRSNIDDEKLVKSSIPESVSDLFYEEVNANKYNLNCLSEIFHYLFSVKSKNEILSIVDFTEDIYNRFINVMKSNFLIDDIILNMCSKNFTKTRIQRMVLAVLLNHTKKDLINFNTNGYPFVRVLGFKKEKEFLLSNLIDKSSIKIVTNIKNAHKVLSKKELARLNNDIKSTKTFLLSNEDDAKKVLDENVFENQMIVL